MTSFFKGKGNSKRGKALESGLLQVTGLAMSVGGASPLPSSQNVRSTPSSQASLTSQSAGQTTGVSGTTEPTPSTGRMGEVGSAAYVGLTSIVQGLYDCSDMFLPLKTAAGIFLTVSGVAERVSANREELKELEAKLNSILSTVEMYKTHNGISTLHSRIERFCENIVRQMEAVNDLQNHSLWMRTAEGMKDADKITKAFRDMTILCDIFQMDTQLNTNLAVEEILQRLRHDSCISKLNHAGTSYKTRFSSYGDPTGCMEGTRAQILADLDGWALKQDSKKVYWMAGAAGTGKSTIAQTFCEILDEKNMLGASFFCSRASENTNNVRLIIPTIVHTLSSASPSIESLVIQALESEPALAEPTYIKIDNQFRKLIVEPTRQIIGDATKWYKVVVIDGLDECRDLPLVSSFIQLILTWASKLPLKIFIASREDYWIRQAFDSQSAEAFYLHDVEQDIVKDDIVQYVKASLQQIHTYSGKIATEGTWPPPSEVSNLVKQSSPLFIYAATAIRYIRDGGAFYKSRLSDIAHDAKSGEQLSDIDDLYAHILLQACHKRKKNEILLIRLITSMIIFLRTPLSVQALGALSGLDAAGYLLCLTSVIHLPSNEDPTSTVTPFHASFPDFVTDPTRCSTARSPNFPALATADSHTMLASKCLDLMNRSLHRNLWGVPEELTVSCRGRSNTSDDVDKFPIPEALKYACLYWASHISEVKTPGPELIITLHVFFHEHLLHWIECLSVLGELPTVVESLADVATTLSGFKSMDTQCDELRLLAEDARRCLQANFECIETHCFQIYQSALVWLPKTSLIRNIYATDVPHTPKFTLGLSGSWGITELVINTGHRVNSVVFSPDGRQIVAGLDDGMVWICSAKTGKVEAKLDDDMSCVNSVTFSQDATQIATGSSDPMVRIWNAKTGEMETKLEAHTDSVNSVTFSQDGRQIASGSSDSTIRIWNVKTGEVEARLESHKTFVNSVAFSQDGSQIASGSSEGTVRIWNASTRELQATLEGHTSLVTSVAFSPDGGRVVSGSRDDTVRIWNATTGVVEAELEGHTGWVRSVAFSQDGGRVVSGSDDRTVRIWNATTGVVETKLEGHTSGVTSVAFSPDGSQVISGSYDRTIRIWSVLRIAEAEATLGAWVACVAFSPDGSRITSGGGDDMVRIWNASTGELQATLKGHTSWVTSVTFSPDGSRVISGSWDNTVRIWNASTGVEEAKLEGHTHWVLSVAFSQDGGRVVSGSYDSMVWIWNVITGVVEAKLEGHTYWVNSVAFSPDSSQVISGSDRTIKIWNVNTGEQEVNIEVGSYVKSVAFVQDGSQVAIQTTTGEHLIYDVARGDISPWDPPPPAIIGPWIVGVNGDCWIPPHECNFITSDVSPSRNRVCLGYPSGRMAILDLTVAE